MKINVNSLTHFSSLGTSLFRKTWGGRPSPKIKICASDNFKSSTIKIFLLIDQVFVAHGVKLRELKNDKEGAIMTLFVERKE